MKWNKVSSSIIHEIKKLVKIAASRDIQLVAKLNLNNYSTWVVKAEMLLIKEERLEVISDDPSTSIVVVISNPGHYVKHKPQLQSRGH